jgi:hypothetical protein
MGGILLYFVRFVLEGYPEQEVRQIHILLQRYFERFDVQARAYIEDFHESSGNSNSPEAVAPKKAIFITFEKTQDILDTLNYLISSHAGNVLLVKNRVIKQPLIADEIEDVRRAIHFSQKNIGELEIEREYDSADFEVIFIQE